MVEIRHEFYELATEFAYPVVTHVFTGKSLSEAARYFRAHMKNDRLLKDTTLFPPEREISVEGVFDGIRYRSVVRVVSRVI